MVRILLRAQQSAPTPLHDLSNFLTCHVGYADPRDAVGAAVAGGNASVFFVDGNTVAVAVCGTDGDIYETRLAGEGSVLPRVNKIFSYSAIRWNLDVTVHFWSLPKSKVVMMSYAYVMYENFGTFW